MDFLSYDKIWFVHLNYIPPLPLCYCRINGKQAEIFGGKTGSHRTGHSESYWDKLKEIIELGYVPVDVAKDLGLLTSDWKPPPIEDINKKVREGL